MIPDNIAGCPGVADHQKHGKFPEFIVSKVHLVFASFLCLVIVGKVHAEWVPLEDLDSRTLYYRAAYTANDDYTYEETHTAAIRVLKKRAIEGLKKTTVTYSASVEKIEILEAYNLKPNGERIDAPKDNYQVRTNQGRDKDSPVFSDRVSITTVFPEVEVGDTLVFTYKRIVHEPMFPKYFTAEQSFSRSNALDEAVIDLTVPAAFHGLRQIRDMKEEISRDNGRVHYRWTWENREPMRDTRKDYSVWNVESNPGFSYSTFGSYREIAEAYGKRARSKVVVSPQIKKLADRIVGNERDEKERARLLYEWVATKITYAGNCVGVGAVVPHDLSFVLDNHMGDCKDHATLLQALLAAEGIESEQALLNSGNVFALPEIPSVNSVNHVINYLPEWKLFVDSTSADTPFGMLPDSDEGKPVLLVEHFLAGMKTPVSLPGSNVQNLVAVIEVLPDGSAKGKVDVELSGMPAVEARAGWRTVSQDNENQWLKDLFTRNGQIGSATMEKDDPKPLLSKFSYSISFEQKEFLLTDSAGGFHVYPPTPSNFSVYDLAAVPDQIEETAIACANGRSQEKLVYRFPANFKILDYPKDKVIDGKYLHYEAHYKFAGNVLTVTRVMDDSTPGPLCAPELVTSQKKTLQRISRNLRSQVVYKPLLDEE
jgi:transglutaminase-like putative cysteine protease